MRLARKLFLLAAMAAAALALTATSASAQVTVSPEVPAGGDCGDVTLIDHAVNEEDTCHVTFVNTGNGIPLHAYIPAKTTISNCTVNLEGFVGATGEGYVTEMNLTDPTGGDVPCTRTACDEPDGTQIPWPLHIEEHAPLNEEVEAVFCLRPRTSPVGTAGNPCEIHLELEETANHVYELGHADLDNGTEVFCENNPPNTTGHPALPFPISIEAHLVTSSTERIEINHDL